MSTCARTRTQMCMHTQICVHTYTQRCTRVCARTHMCTYHPTHRDAHMHVHTPHVHVHTRTHTCAPWGRGGDGEDGQDPGLSEQHTRGPHTRRGSMRHKHDGPRAVRAAVDGGGPPSGSDVALPMLSSTTFQDLSPRTAQSREDDKEPPGHSGTRQHDTLGCSGHGMALLVDGRGQRSGSLNWKGQICSEEQGEMPKTVTDGGDGGACRNVSDGPAYASVEPQEAASVRRPPERGGRSPYLVESRSGAAHGRAGREKCVADGREGIWGVPVSDVFIVLRVMYQSHQVEVSVVSGGRPGGQVRSVLRQLPPGVTSHVRPRNRPASSVTRTEDVNKRPRWALEALRRVSRDTRKQANTCR